MSAPRFPKLALSGMENALALLALASVLFLSLGEILVRTFFRTGIPSSASLINHSTLVFACIGAAIAGRQGRQLGLADAWNPRGLFGAIRAALKAFVSISVLSALSLSSVSMVVQAFGEDAKVGPIPVRVFASVIPLAFSLMTLRAIYRATRRHFLMVILALCAAAFAASSSLAGLVSIVLGEAPTWLWAASDMWNAVVMKAVWPLSIGILLSAAFGVPLFIALSGAAYIAFAATAGAVEIVSFQTYSMLTGNIIPAIPLFTLSGYILADSGAGKRLVALVRSLAGWMRGGPAIAAVLVSAFFTTFTGASGVTILALGALLVYILKENGYKEGRAEGLVAASGSIGLLFPPSLAVIVYGSIAQVSILDLFIGGALPGLLLVVGMAIAGIWGDSGGKRVPFSGKEALSSFRSSIGELLLPVLVIVGYFSGFFTLVETGAFAAAYVIILEAGIRREYSLKTLTATVLKSVPVTGGVLIILASARGVSDFLVDARVPMLLADLAQTYIPSTWMFLALLNITLLAVGCLMDLFSAILVVAPLVIPVAAVFGVHPVHLGVLFLANLGLGFLTPPVGMNLFIASYAFEKPLNKITRSVLPYLGLQVLVVLLITYVPLFTTFFLR